MHFSALLAATIATLAATVLACNGNAEQFSCCIGVSGTDKSVYNACCADLASYGC